VRGADGDEDGHGDGDDDGNGNGNGDGDGDGGGGSPRIAGGTAACRGSRRMSRRRPNAGGVRTTLDCDALENA